MIRISKRSARALVVALLGALLSPAACTDGGVVGGKCRDGFRDCNGVCIDVVSDPSHCGSCENVCLSGVLCVQGVCGGDAGTTVDGGGDAAEDGAADGAFSDRSTPDGDGGGGDGAAGADGSAGDGAAGADAGDGCAPPYDTPQQCGDCTTQCPASEPICALIDGEYACIPMCTAPLVQCGAECVDTNSDPDHCGKCFNKCPSGICQGGQCVGATTGHIVLACMSYEQSFQSSPQTVLLGNAVFLPTDEPVRILAFDQYAQPAVKNKVDQTINWAAQAKGRTFQITHAKTSAQVVAGLNVIDYEVFVVYDQPNAPPGTLGTLGNSWFTTLEPFVKAGGVVIVLNGGGGVAEMGDLITNAGLLSVTGQTSATGATAYNNAPIDAIGVNVISPFLAVEESCTFTTNATPGTNTAFVITNSATPGAGEPLVVHRVP